jgi:HNH endonuclease
MFFADPRMEKWFHRFESHIDKGEEHDDCHLWKDAKDEAGYGVARDWNGKVRRTHIIVYELYTGAPVPDGEVVDHECRVHPCCNFSHLQAKTRKENTLIGIGPTALNAKKTRCTKCKTPYDEDNTQWHSGRRECRTCVRARQRERRQSAKEEKLDSEQ